MSEPDEEIVFRRILVHLVINFNCRLELPLLSQDFPQSFCQLFVAWRGLVGLRKNILSLLV